MNVTQERIKELSTLTLHHGPHTDWIDGHCAMEVVSWLAGDETINDHPSCVCPVIAAFMRRWNDRLSSDEVRTEVLRPLLPLLLETRSTRDVERRRSWLAVDWSVRTRTPAVLRMAGLTAHAEAMERLPEMVSESALVDVRAAILAAREAARALRDERWAKLRAAYAADAAAAAASYDAAYAAASSYDAAYAASAASAASDAAADYASTAAAAAAAAYAASAASTAAAAASAASASASASYDAAYASSAADDALFDRLVAAAKTGGYKAARRLADETIGSHVRERFAAEIAAMTASAQDLVRRMCATGEIREAGVDVASK